MATRDQTCDLPAMFLRASFAPSSVNDEKRTVEMTWTTGARVMRGGFFTEPYLEELSLDPKHVRLDRLNNGAPLLAAHDSYDLGSVLGVVENARVGDGKGTATVRFTTAGIDENADQVFRKVKDGILQNVSVGYRVHRLEKVEGGDGKIPVMRATDWEPFELSVVPIGADDGAGFRSASESQPKNPCVIVTRKDHAMPEQLPIPAVAPAPAPSKNPVEELTRAATEHRVREAGAVAEAAARATEAALADERIRETEIRALARKCGWPDSITDKLVREGAKIEDVRLAALNDLTERSDASSPRASILAGEDASEKFIRGATAAIIERIGHTAMIQRAQQTEHGKRYLAGVSLDGGEFRGMRMEDLARASLERVGQSTRGMYGEALIKRALSFRGDSGMNTSSDFSVLLESVVNKVFLGAYAIAPTTWQSWCGKKSVQDFRTTTFYRPGTFGVLDSVTESGEVKHKNIPDGAKATIAPATKGNIIGISRKAMVNDDLGAFRDLAAGLGQAAAATVEADAYAMLTTASGVGANAPDGTALFTSGHGNIGSTGAMSVATLDSMRAKMALQKDPSGNVYLALEPAVLVVPVELKGTAKVFNASAADPTDYKNANVANKVNGLFREIVSSPYLSAQSSTRHYAFADPGIAPVCVVGFIDGQEAPRIESDVGFEYDGMQMRVVLDYGTAVIDTRGAVTCAGQ